MINYYRYRLFQLIAGSCLIFFPCSAFSMPIGNISLSVNYSNDIDSKIDLSKDNQGQKINNCCSASGSDNFSSSINASGDTYDLSSSSTLSSENTLMSNYGFSSSSFNDAPQSETTEKDINQVDQIQNSIFNDSDLTLDNINNNDLANGSNQGGYYWYNRRNKNRPSPSLKEKETVKQAFILNTLSTNNDNSMISIITNSSDSGYENTSSDKQSNLQSQTNSRIGNSHSSSQSTSANTQFINSFEQAY